VVNHSHSLLSPHQILLSRSSSRHIQTFIPFSKLAHLMSTQIHQLKGTNPLQNHKKCSSQKTSSAASSFLSLMSIPSLLNICPAFLRSAILSLSLSISLRSVLSYAGGIPITTSTSCTISLMLLGLGLRLEFLC